MGIESDKERQYPIDMKDFTANLNYFADNLVSCQIGPSPRSMRSEMIYVPPMFHEDADKCRPRAVSLNYPSRMLLHPLGERRAPL